MERKLFNIIETILRQALAEGASETMLRHAGRLRLAVLSEKPAELLERALRDKQVAALDRLIQRHRPARPLAPGQIAHGTAETIERRQPHPMDYLPQRKEWRNEYTWAAEEIVQVYMAFQQALIVGGPSLDAVRVDTSRRGFRQPLEALPERLHRIWQHHYRPWAKEMEATPAHHWRGARKAEAPDNPVPFVRRSMLEVAIDVVVDGFPTRDLEEMMGLKHGTVPLIVMAALARYAEIGKFYGARRLPIDVPKAAMGGGGPAAA